MVRGVPQGHPHDTAAAGAAGLGATTGGLAGTACWRPQGCGKARGSPAALPPHGAVHGLAPCPLQPLLPLAPPGPCPAGWVQPGRCLAGRNSH